MIKITNKLGIFFFRYLGYKYNQYNNIGVSKLLIEDCVVYALFVNLFLIILNKILMTKQYYSLLFTLQ